MTARPDPNSAVLQAFTRGMFTHLVTALARSLRELDLNLSEIAALHLVDQKKALGISDLATSLAMPMPAASRLVDGLVARGLVVRTENAADRRARILTLTPTAAELIDRTSRERVTAAFAAAASMPGAAADTIGAALQKLIERDSAPRSKRKTS